MTTWDEASERYEAHKPQGVQRQLNPRETRAAEELTEFLANSEGASALRLLKASRRFIRLGELGSSNGRAVVFIFDGEGLRSSYEAHGMWTAYVPPEHLPKPRFEVVTPEDVIRVAGDPRLGDMRGVEILSLIRRELDSIAQRAP